MIAHTPCGWQEPRALLCWAQSLQKPRKEKRRRAQRSETHLPSLGRGLRTGQRCARETEPRGPNPTPAVKYPWRHLLCLDTFGGGTGERRAGQGDTCMLLRLSLAQLSHCQWE